MKTHSHTFIVLTMLSAACLAANASAQDFSNRNSLGHDVLNTMRGTNYNPVTGVHMKVPKSPDGIDSVPTTGSVLTSLTEDVEEVGTPAAAGISESACGESVCCEPCETCCPCACWNFMAEALWFDRNTPDSFGTTYPGSNEPDILNTNDLGFRFAPGYRLTLSRMSGVSGWEGSYLGLTSWSSSAQVVDPDRGLDSFLRVGVPDVFNFRNAYSQSVYDGTDLHSFELNKRRVINNGGLWQASLLAGFRYFYIKDDFLFLSHDSPPPSDDVGFYAVQTRNNLWGGQIGGTATRSLGAAASAGIKLKAGLFANFSKQNSHLVNVEPPDAPTTDLLSSRSETRLAAVLETGVFGTYQFGSNFGIRGGYDVFIVGNVALATNQLDFTANTFHTQPFIASTNTLVFHGPTVGAWYAW